MARQEVHPMFRTQPVPPYDPGDGPPGEIVVTQPDQEVPGGGVDPLDPYPNGVPDFRNDQSGMGPPDPNHYDPNEDVDQFGYQTGINGEKNYDINVGMTGGLMDTITGMRNSPFANKGYGVREGAAVNRGVQQEELSQYQLQQMLGSDSPLMRQRAEQGMAKGGSRGLMNSSLSIGAAQGAMIAGAQPFALQDAGWYGQTAADNMDATNRMSEANLRARTASMEAGARRDSQMLVNEQSGFGDIRRAMINMETREDEQAWKTSEGEAGRDWQGGQNDINREWTSNENLMTNTLAQWQTKMDSATRLGISREQAYSEMYASIMANPDKKFSAAERRDAVDRMGEALDKRYAETGEVEPGPFETSVLNGAPDDSLMLDKKPLPGTTTTTYGDTTVTVNRDGSTTINIKSSDPYVEETFNALPDMDGPGMSGGDGSGRGGSAGTGRGVGTGAPSTGGGSGSAPPTDPFGPESNVLV